MMARVVCIASAVVALAGCRRQPQAMVMPDSGHEVYMQRCALCHNTNGEGIPGIYPPVTGSEWVSGPPERLASLILDGISGPDGRYNGVMPGWRGVLDDAQIAALMTWLRRTQSGPPVTPVQIGHVRMETQGRGTFWTVGDLRSLRLR
jgi:mono/diheme cytochrome c family protein